jgi:hypothetical protein
MAGIMDIFGGLLGPAVDALKGDPNRPQPGIIESIGSRLMGPGAFGDPLDTFKMYAPPNVAANYTPEQQAQYGRQIQSQMRKINADYRPTYPQVQEGISADAKYGAERAAANLVQQQQQMDQNQLGGIFNPAGPNFELPPADGTKQIASVPVDANAPRSANAKKYFQAAKYYATSGRADLAKKYHDIGISLDPNPEDAVRTLEYLGYNVEGTETKGLDLLKQLNESKTSKTTITNVNGPQGKGDEKYWESLAKTIPEKEAQAVAANRTNLALRDMIELNNKGTFSGMLAPGAIGATQFLQSFGMNPAEDKLANTREFQASANILVLDFMGAMGGARGFSKEESAILYDAFPKIIDDPKARARIAKMLVTRNNRIIDEYKALTRQYEGGGGRPLPKVQVEPLELGTTGASGWSIKRKGP